MVSYESYLYDLALSPSTIQSYIADLKRFATYLGRPPETARPSDLVMYRNILSQHYQPASVNRHLASIARFLKFARDQKLTETRLPEKLWMRKRRQTAPKSLTEAQQAALIAAVTRRGSIRDITLVRLLLATGLRSAECAALTVGDVDLSSGWLHVRAGKGDIARDIPLAAELRTYLALYINRERGAKTGTTRLFVGERGPLGCKGISYVTRKFGYQAGIGPIGPHTLRHSFAANLVRGGTPLDRVGLLLGHASLDVTRIYTYPSPADLMGEVERIAA